MTAAEAPRPTASQGSLGSRRSSSTTVPSSRSAFCAYAYPEPEGFRSAKVGPSDAHFDETLGEFLLPYEAVRTAADPDAALLEFLQSTYEAAADLGGLDRKALEFAGAPRG